MFIYSLPVKATQGTFLELLAFLISRKCTKERFLFTYFHDICGRSKGSQSREVCTCVAALLDGSRIVVVVEISAKCYSKLVYFTQSQHGSVSVPDTRENDVMDFLASAPLDLRQKIVTMF